MKKPIIAVDIDDVLAVENEAVRQFANQRYGHQHAKEDYLVPGDYWGYWESVQGVDKAEGARRYHEYVASGVKAELQVMEGAIAALDELKRRYDLIIVTARHAHLKDITEKWLNRHFPATFSHVAFVELWTGSIKGSKAEVCAHLKADYLIDDNPAHLELAVSAGIKGVLFGSYGWSVDWQPMEMIPHCQDWREVREYFDGR